MTWQDPYGPPGRQNPYPGYGTPRASNGPAIGALIANIVAAVLCCVGVAWLPGIILAAVAINRAPADPDSARNLTIGAWVCLAMNVVLAVALAVTLYATRNG